MPILDVEIVVRPGESLPPHLAAEIADRAGEILSTGAGHTWVKLHPLPAEHYAENGVGTPTDLAPVFVSILKARMPSPARMRDEVTRLTAAIARACGRPPENVHLLYCPDAVGRIAFGAHIHDDGTPGSHYTS